MLPVDSCFVKTELYFPINTELPKYRNMNKKDGTGHHLCEKLPIKERFPYTGEQSDGSSFSTIYNGGLKRSPKVKLSRKFLLDFDLPSKHEWRPSETHKKIVRFFKWGKSIEARLRSKMDTPKGSEFVLTCFAKDLCHIHKNETSLKKNAHWCHDHHYLYVALRLCFVLNISIKAIVSALLREIYLCEGSLDAIFSIIPSTNSHTDLTVNRNKFTVYPGRRKYEKSAFQYFVKSICPLEKDTREYEDNVFIPDNVLNKPLNNLSGDTPLLAAVIQCNLSMVLLLLRHGANPFVCKWGEVFSPLKICPVNYVLRMLNMMMWLHDRSGVKVKMQMEFCYLCLSFFARAVYALDIRKSSGKISTTIVHGTKHVLFEVHPKLAQLLDLDKKSWCTPPLTHVCRYNIRCALQKAKKHNLPDAIKKLPVPQVIQDYLDLLC